MFFLTRILQLSCALNRTDEAVMIICREFGALLKFRIRGTIYAASTQFLFPTLFASITLFLMAYPAAKSI